MPAACRPLPAFASTVFCAGAPFVRGGGAALPQRVRILAWGENLGRTTKARIVVGPKTLACLAANQLATACERVPLDYEHQSVKGHPNYVPDPRPVPGHGGIEIVEGEGVYLTALQYTPNGEQFAPNYQDVSAVAYLDAEANLLFIRSVALTQHGDVAGMEFAEAVAASASLSNPQSTPHTTPTAMLDYKALLLAKLGLPEAATDEEVTAALTPEDDATGSVEMSAAAETAQNDPNTGAIATLTADFEAFRRQSAIERAVAQGKTIPLADDVLATLPYAALTAMLDGLPAGTVATAAGSASKEVPAARQVALSAEQAAAAKSLGLTETEYRRAIS